MTNTIEILQCLLADLDAAYKEASLTARPIDVLCRIYSQRMAILRAMGDMEAYRAVQDRRSVESRVKTALRWILGLH